jgi:hypothetical protein
MSDLKDRLSQAMGDYEKGLDAERKRDLEQLRDFDAEMTRRGAVVAPKYGLPLIDTVGRPVQHKGRAANR